MNDIKLTSDCATSTFSLSRTAKANWLTALRSGEYKQVRGSLTKPVLKHFGYAEVCRGYCSLGLLAKTLGAHDKDMEDNGSLVLPLRLSEFKVSLSHRSALKTALVDLNDEKKMSFEMIADIVERSVPCHD